MKIQTIMGLFLILIVMVGCEQNVMKTLEGTGSVELPVHISANALSLPTFEEKKTKTGMGENTIQEAVIILFDERNMFLDVYPVLTDRVTIPHSSAKRSLYIVANASQYLFELSKGWIPGITDKGHVEDDLVQERRPGAMPQLPFAMYGSLIFDKGIHANSAITSNGQATGTPLLLRRNVAKVTIDVAPSLVPTFKIRRITLCRAPRKGYILRNIPLDIDQHDHYSLVDAHLPLYSFASNAETTAIIEAETENGLRYFKIAIKDALAQGAIGLKHNFWYKITIVKKTGIGFSSLEDAIQGHVVDHVDVALEVQDITMHDFIFGKDFFIATSNSHYQQYGRKDDQSYYEVCKVRFANTMHNNAVLGNTMIEVLEGDIELSSITMSEVNNAHNHTTYVVMARSPFAHADGVIRLHFAYLTKDITVKIRPELGIESDHFIENTTALSGAVLEDNLTWCGVNDERVFSKNQHMDLNTDQGGTLYFTLQHAASIPALREATAHISKVKGGMTKLRVIQLPK